MSAAARKQERGVGELPGKTSEEGALEQKLNYCFFPLTFQLQERTLLCSLLYP